MANDAEPIEDDEGGMSDEEIDRNLIETFPASDPPSWTLGTDHTVVTSSDDDESADESRED